MHYLRKVNNERRPVETGLRNLELITHYIFSILKVLVLIESALIFLLRLMI